MLSLLLDELQMKMLATIPIGGVQVSAADPSSAPSLRAAVWPARSAGAPSSCRSACRPARCDSHTDNTTAHGDVPGVVVLIKHQWS